jgi:hypothetical protein
VDCHDPHDDSEGITFGTVGNGAVLDGREFPFEVPRISERTRSTQRDRMVERCSVCHPRARATAALGQADRIKFEADATLQEMAELIRALERKRLIGPSRDSFNPSSRAGHVILGANQIFKNTSRAERLCFGAFKVYHPLMWNAAYHGAPAQIIEARRELDRTLVELKEEAERLGGLPRGAPEAPEPSR